GDGPDEARQLTGDRRGDDIGRLAVAGELAVARAQSQLRFPGDLADRPGLRLLPKQELTADPGREAVTPSRLDQEPAGRAVASLGETAALDAGTARMLGRHQPEIGHQLARIGKTRRSPSSAISVAALTSAMPRIVCNAATTGASVQSGSIASICAVSRSRRAAAASTAAMLEHDMKHCLLELESREPSAMQLGPCRPPVMTAVAH